MKQKKAKPTVGNIIVLNELADAGLWKVLEIDGQQLTIVDAELEQQGFNLAPQYTSIHNAYEPTKQQLQDEFGPRLKGV